jgi:hypothetical protein
VLAAAPRLIAQDGVRHRAAAVGKVSMLPRSIVRSRSQGSGSERHVTRFSSRPAMCCAVHQVDEAVARVHRPRPLGCGRGGRRDAPGPDHGARRSTGPEDVADLVRDRRTDLPAQNPAGRGVSTRDDAPGASHPAAAVVPVDTPSYVFMTPPRRVKVCHASRHVGGSPYWQRVASDQILRQPGRQRGGEAAERVEAAAPIRARHVSSRSEDHCSTAASYGRGRRSSCPRLVRPYAGTPRCR